MKIPPQAKSVFTGKIFEVYQWEQKMFDGSFETFEMIKRPHTVEIVATQQDKILLTFQSQPNKHNFYSLFSGRVETGEDPLSSAKRELREEGGLASADWHLYKTFEPESKIDWQIHTFIARNCSKVATQQLDAGEKIEVRSYTFDEYITLALSEEYWGTALALDIARMKAKGTLDSFKQQLFP